MASKTAGARQRETIVSGIRISHPDKALWPAEGRKPAITKLDLARYYEMAAARMLPHIAGRPISMVRAPDGINGQTFFQRHAMQGGPNFRLMKTERFEQAYVTIDDKPGLVSLAQAGVLEIHPWGCKKNEPEVPARIIFDLDPAPNVSFGQVIAAALELRKRLTACGLVPFVKTTGGKGLHVVVPVKGTPKTPATWPDAKEFAHALCAQMEKDKPDNYTTTISKSARGGRIFLDYLRNDMTSTAVAPWSPRAAGRHDFAAAQLERREEGARSGAFHVAGRRQISETGRPVGEDRRGGQIAGVGTEKDRALNLQCA